jgi:hypothetical protein
MGSPISPGVYSTITDLSNYVGVVPGTIGFIAGLTKQGEDNVFKFQGSRTDFIREFGQPNINTYGKNYGQGPYMSYNYLGQSGSLFFMRCLPDDAAYANLQINCDVSDDGEREIVCSYNNSLQSKIEINTALATDSTAGGGLFTYPICILYPIGRGDYYNSVGVRFTKYSNPLALGIYVMDIYEVQSNGQEAIIESFEVSFDPASTDNSGDSNWIVYVLNTYSSVLRADMTIPDGEYATGYNYIKNYDVNIGNVEVISDDSTANPNASLVDDKQDFSQWIPTGNLAEYLVVIQDSRGNELWGWLGECDGADLTTAIIYPSINIDGVDPGWGLGSAIDVFKYNSTITYQVKKANLNIASAFENSNPVPLKKGSDGSLLDSSGKLVPNVAQQILAEAYAGTIDDSVLDTENVYFTMTFDCGYPSAVKTQVSNLAQTRGDCVAIMDNGDNTNVTAALSARQNVHTFNNFYTALYEEYNQVYDIFTGQNIWVSPIYHMSYLLPKNDRVGEVWTAAAGFNRAAIDSITQLRFNPKLGERDQMYLEQLNPIVKFNEGYVVWGQQTSQAKNSKMQNLNVVRLVLYVKRALEKYCRFFIFEQNDAITWSKISNDIVPFLEDVKRRRGLYGYTVEVGSTAYELKIKKCHVNVTLDAETPIEQIALNFFIV